MENCKPVNTPMAIGIIEQIILYNDQASKQEINLYGLYIGSAIYIAVYT